MVDWGKTYGNVFVFKKENKAQGEQHQEWGGERNDNMLAAGFVENVLIGRKLYTDSELYLPKGLRVTNELGYL